MRLDGPSVAALTHHHRAGPCAVKSRRESRYGIGATSGEGTGMIATETASNTEVWLDKVRGLAPIIAEHREESEKQRFLAKPVYEAMRDLGLFNLWKPKVLGGDEADLHTALEITELLATFDGSAAWNFMIGLQSSALLGFM